MAVRMEECGSDLTRGYHIHQLGNEKSMLEVGPEGMIEPRKEEVESLR